MAKKYITRTSKIARVSVKGINLTTNTVDTLELEIDEVYTFGKKFDDVVKELLPDDFAPALIVKGSQREERRRMELNKWLELSEIVPEKDTEKDA